MDPVSLIVAALAAGASAAFQDTARDVVKDAYAGLKSRVRRRLADEPEATAVFTQHEEAPDEWQAALERELGRVGIAADEEVVRAAQELLAAIDPEGARTGKYNVTISGGKGIVVGDHAHVTMTFDDGE